MVKLEEIYEQGIFKLNGVPYQKGAYRIAQYGPEVELAEVGSRIFTRIVREDWQNWVNDQDQPYASLDDLLDDLAEKLFYGTAEIQLGSPDPIFEP